MMSEAYETLGGRGEEDGHKFEEALLQNALSNKKMSAMEYVAGSITYKVRLYYLVMCISCSVSSWIFHEVSSRTED